MLSHLALGMSPSDKLGTELLPLPPISKGIYQKKDKQSSQKKIKDLSFLNGDIVFIRSQSLQSKALEEVTRTKWTHVGILFRLIQNEKKWTFVSSQDSRGKWFVFEANAHVQFTPLEKFVGTRSHAFFRFKIPLSEAQVRSVFEVSLTRIGKPYDLFFILSRDGVHKDDFDYCSELVWYAFAKSVQVALGERVLVSDLPMAGREAQILLKKRFDKKAPYTIEQWKKQYVIPPQSIFESPLLSRIDL